MLGSYSIATATGLIVATGAVDALIWACRWTPPNASELLAIIESLRVNAVVTGTITTAVPYDLEVYFANGFTVAPSSNQVAATMTGQKRRSDFGATQGMAVYTLNTAAAGMTGHTFSLDPHPIARISGASGTVIGNQFFGGGMVSLLDPEANERTDRLPIELGRGQNEGLAIRAPLAGPANGTFRVAVSMDWKERSIRR